MAGRRLPYSAVVTFPPAGGLLRVATALTGLTVARFVMRRRRRSEAERHRATRARVQQTFHGLIESSPDAIVLTDDAGRIVLVNVHLERMFGYGRDELLEQPVEVLMPEQFREGHRGQRARYMHAPVVRPMGSGLELSGRRKDGRVFPVEISLSPVEIAGQRMVVSAIRDVTDRKRLEEERAELIREQARRAEAEAATERLRAIQTVLDVALTHLAMDELLGELVARVTDVMRADTGAILLLDESDQALTVRATRGLEPARDRGLRIPLGRGFAGRVAAERRPIIVPDAATAEIVSPVLRARGVRSLLGAPLLLEGRVLGVLHVGTLALRHFTDEDAAVLQVVAERAALALDRSRLYAAERQARAEAEEARRNSLFLAEAGSALAASLDEDTTLRTVARLAVAHLADLCLIDAPGDGGAPRRVASAHVDPAVDRDPALEQRRLPPAPDGSDPLAGVLSTGRAARGTGGGLAYMVVPMLARGRMVGAIAFVREAPGPEYGAGELALAEDLARRAALAADNARLYEEAQQANQTKDEFLATLSHELRTPLTAILGWTRMLQMGRLDPGRAARALETIERNARAQVKLIEDLLDVSRIVTGKLRLDVWTVDLVRVTEAAVDSVRLAAQAKTIRIDTALDPSVTVLGDAHRLQQVIWNLLSNALKFTPKGGLVEVRLERVYDEARLSVRDTGRGIPTGFLPFVFDRFRQADSSMTRTYGGLGLGLSIVRELVELHGGRVEVASAGEGHGATFTVVLPLSGARRREPEAEVPRAREAEVAAAGRLPLLDGVRVLVVDDEADTRDLIATVLEGCGAEVVTARTAAEGLAELERQRPDVVLSDLAMPGDDGFVFIRTIRAHESPGSRPLPAAALTAYAHGDDRVAVLAAGFDMHIPKPIDPAELAQAVAELARRSRPVAG
jgi:PAS domain S-box-containing protein